MQDDQPSIEDYGDEPAPVRPPTGREKFAVLLPALIAFVGLVAMLIIFAVLAGLTRS